MAKEYECQQCGTIFHKLSELMKHRRLLGHRDEYECDICNKRFGRKDNLERHKQRHLNSNHDCSECGKVFNRPDTLLRHKQLVHNQSGAGEKRSSDGDVPLAKRLKSDIRSHYDITKISQNTIEKFKTTKSAYRITFKDLEVTGLTEILGVLRRLLNAILEDITSFSSEDDLIRLSVQSPELDFPIQIRFTKKKNLTADQILSEIERVLQSFEEITLDSGLEIELIHVKNPEGGGGSKRRNIIALDEFLQKKRCIVQIKNKDDLCCARAIITAKSKLDNHEKWTSIRQGCVIQETLAKELHELAGVPLQKCGIAEIKLFQKVLQSYQIHVVSKDHFNAIIYKGPDSDKKLYIYYHDDHYSVITSMAAFLDRAYYCTKCQKGYSNKEKHKCNDACRYCFKIHAKSDEDWVYCKDCNRYFKGIECYQSHTIETTNGNSTCKRYYRCQTCDQAVNKSNHKQEHICGEVYCKTCKEYFMDDHLCYMNPEEPSTSAESGVKQNTQTYKFFDFECTQDDLVECDEGYIRDEESNKCGNCHKALCGSFQHRPNLCVAHRVCEICLDGSVTENSQCKHCGNNEWIFRGSKTTTEFCRWLFSDDNAGAIAICHNMKGYDSYPILQYLYSNCIIPDVIVNGTKYMSIEVRQCNIRLIDSFNFINCALSKLPSMFGFQELAKGYFPHLFNKKENQNKQLSTLPDVSFYNPDAMKAKDRALFLEWYAANKCQPFILQKELLRYCRSDVDILRRCCLEFRKLFINMTSDSSCDTGIDPFKECITIASACNLVFRRKYLTPETIGIIPAHGYRSEDKQSLVALKWLKYVAHSKGIAIQHARNGGEKYVGNYKLDGHYQTAEGVEVAMEFLGCFWHGCPLCFARDTINPVNNLSMQDLYQQTLDKKNALLEEGYQYEEIWECQFQKQVCENKYMSDFIASMAIVDPLEPRDAFFGGRTEAFMTNKEAKEGEEIKYYDVTSLYPYINKTGKVPLGHPRIITEHFEDISNYEGLIKCKIAPPRNLHIPVLPTKIDGKLLFTLCKSCAEIKESSCIHSEDERALTGTWVTDEVKLAVAKGYKILEVFEIWHFDNMSQYDAYSKTGGIFTEYVNTFLKLKQQSSGWPRWCQTSDDKKDYIESYLQKEGIEFEPHLIEKNPGLRTVAKLMLNSFWGKFGQRSNLTKVEYTAEPQLYFDLLTSDQQEVTNVNFVNEHIVELAWKYKTDFVDTARRTNVVIAAYTTAQARIKLYSYLDMLQDRVIYCDTDSIVFTTKPGQCIPPLGDFLGDLTDEEPDGKITHFVSAGPKNYAYKVETESGDRTVCKVKGITLSYKNAIDINFDVIKEMITTSDNAVVYIRDDFKIVRDRKSCMLLTQSQTKTYRVVFDKRILMDNYKTMPYGF